MHSRVRISILGAVMLAMVACSGERPILPTEPPAVASASRRGGGACREITQREIIALFLPGARGKVTSQLAHIRNGVRAGDVEPARDAMFGLWQLTLTSFYAGDLRGGDSPSTRAAVLAFGQALYCLVGLDASGLAQVPDPLGADNVMQVVFPSSDDQDVVTGGGNAGVRIPGNTLSEPVTIAITLITTSFTPPSGPLNTRLDQYGPFFDFQVYPTQSFSQPVLVSQCLESPEEGGIPETVRIAHNVGEGIEILPLAESFLACSGGESAARPGVPALLASGQIGRALGALGAAAARLVTPSVAYAVSLGIGGMTTSFSPFGGVDALGYLQPSSLTPRETRAGTAVASSPSVLVRTLLGTPLPGASVVFTVADGGGRIAAGDGEAESQLTIGTGDDGTAGVGSWTVGSGTNTLTATASFPTQANGVGVGVSGNPVTFSATGTAIVPYLDVGYRYLLGSAGHTSGFEAPAFDDATWATGSAAFGSGAANGTSCPLDATVQTPWPSTAQASDMLLRKSFELPAWWSEDLTVGVAIDNDVQLFVNGVDVTATASGYDAETGFVSHEGCATQGSVVFTVSRTLLREGTNVLAVRARDRGVVSYVDVMVAGSSLNSEVAARPASAPPR